MPIEPGAHLQALVAGEVVEDDADDLAGRNLGFKRVEEADELLKAVTLQIAGPRT